ncbi:MAG: multiprotein bridging factor aMBF1 [Methanomicrobiales archaeon]|nr:multiprotein bridging factor aMBF1 [Methanomicrobiales archaeon]
MQCELCGNEIKGHAKLVNVEGAELQVCAQCARYGREVQQPKRPSPGLLAKGTARPEKTTKTQRPRKDLFDFMGSDVVEEYGERIRKAREAKGWSQKELALEIKEREILIRKIEKCELIPEDAVRAKLEKALGISLTETELEDVKARRGGRMDVTLGDLISIRKPQK